MRGGLLQGILAASHAAAGEPPPGGGTPVWEETFDGTGYDNSWSVTTGDQTIDPDFEPDPMPQGFAGRVLRVARTSSGNTFADHTFSPAIAQPFFWRVVLYVVTPPQSGSPVNIINSWSPSFASGLFSCNVENHSGAYRLRNRYEPGATNHFVDIALKTPYRFEVKYDRDAGEYEWRVDGVQVATGTVAGSHPAELGFIHLGVLAQLGEVWFDHVAVAQDDWLGAPGRP